MDYHKSVLRARGANGIRQANALRADRVTREIASPPVFGKGNRADAKHVSAFLFLAVIDRHDADGA
jgi:hypothetical protein